MTFGFRLQHLNSGRSNGYGIVSFLYAVTTQIGETTRPVDRRERNDLERAPCFSIIYQSTFWWRWFFILSFVRPNDFESNLEIIPYFFTALEKNTPPPGWFNFCLKRQHGHSVIFSPTGGRLCQMLAGPDFKRCFLPRKLGWFPFLHCHLYHLEAPAPQLEGTVFGCQIRKICQIMLWKLLVLSISADIPGCQVVDFVGEYELKGLAKGNLVLKW